MRKGSISPPEPFESGKKNQESIPGRLLPLFRLDLKSAGRI